MRLLKQIIYGVGYLAVFFLIGLLIYNSHFKAAPTCFDGKQNQNETGIDCGGPCAPCEIGTLSSLKATQIKRFSGDNQTVVTAEIKNPNLDWGADYFSYTFDVYGKSGEKIKSIAKASFIYAGEIKYVLEAVEISSDDVASVEISFSGIEWKPAEQFPKPTVQSREIKTESSVQDGERITVSGFISNNNAFSLSKIRIVAFLLNRSGVQISASKTELENLSAFGEKPFKINFPKSVSLMETSTSSLPSLNLSQADPSKTKIYVESLR